MALGLFIGWWSIRDTSVYKETDFGSLFSSLTFLVVGFTLVYYGYRAIHWFRYKFLWRVRRRLVVTYVFIGLTPILLLVTLSLIAIFGINNQGASKLIESQIAATENTASISAEWILEQIATMPNPSNEPAVQARIKQYGEELQTALPGTHLSCWINQTNETDPHSFSLQAVYEPDLTGSTLSGQPMPSVGDSLPQWLSAKTEWVGTTYQRIEEKSDDQFIVPSIRALVRKPVGEKTYTILLAIPITRKLIEHYKSSTGIEIQPYFANLFGPGGEPVIRGRIRLRSERAQALRLEGSVDSGEEPHPQQLPSVDQFGVPLRSQSSNFYLSYPVLIEVTNWSSGRSHPYPAFVFRSLFWSSSFNQLESWNALGRVWIIVLATLGLLFLGVELIALFSAGLMTRSITGAVAKLHHATQLIKGGDFSHRVYVRSRDQLGELAISFNEMSANIESLLKERVEHERLEREVEIAARVQTQLFPRGLPKLKASEFYGECRAARSIAGDYYDFIDIEPGVVLFALGDVSGKGVGAALVMSNLQASLRSRAFLAKRPRQTEHAMSASAHEAHVTKISEETPTPQYSLAAITEAINAQLFHSTDSNVFATLFTLLYDEQECTIHYTNAGHNAGIIARIDGSIERLSKGGLMVGAFSGSKYEAETTRLDPGDLLVLFSDGISEVQNEYGIEYGEKRLEQFIVARRMYATDELVAAIYKEVDDWNMSRERIDDQTLLVLKCKP